MEEIIQSYYENNAKKLHDMVDKILRKFTWIYYKDEFYSLANVIFVEEIKKYDGERSFEAFLFSRLRNKIFSLITSMNADKRMMKEKQDDGSYTFIHDISIETPIGENENSTLGDIIPSDYDLEKELDKSFGFSTDDKVEIYLNSLPKATRVIMEMKMHGLTVSDIKKDLNITESEYNKRVRDAKYNENLAKFKNYNTYKEESVMCEVMPIDTTDSYRMDKNSLSSLLEDKKKGKINCKHLLQREAYQWSPRQVNKLLTRILNNQPITEIVICEQVTTSNKKRSYLIDGLQRLSYCELFIIGSIHIGEEGSEYAQIEYEDYKLGVDGKPALDEDGDAIYETVIFDVIGKKFNEFPEFLKDRFKKFNVNVTTYFACDDERIAYHIRNYNNHEGMNNNQYEITNVSIDTTKKVKAISEHTFFKDGCGKYTDKNKTKGVLNRVVMESVMTNNFLGDWKKKVEDTYTFVDEHVEDWMFGNLTDTLDRLSVIVNKEIRDLFNTTNSPVWFTVFESFKKLNIDDTNFLRFLKEFKSSIDTFTYEGQVLTEIYRNRSTKDKKVITDKINSIISVMFEFLNVGQVIETVKEDIKEDIGMIPDHMKEYVDAFSKSNIVSLYKANEKTDINRAAINTYYLIEENLVSDNIREDIELYLPILNEWTLNVDNNSKLFDVNNLPSLLCLIGYACLEDIDKQVEQWFIEFFKDNNTYLDNQKENYLHMVTSVNEYIKLEE